MKVDAVRARFARIVAAPAPEVVVVAEPVSGDDGLFSRVRALVLVDGKLDRDALGRVRRILSQIERDPSAATLLSAREHDAPLPPLTVDFSRDFETFAEYYGDTHATPPSSMTLVGKSGRGRDVYTFTGGAGDMTCPNCGGDCLTIGKTDHFGEVFNECGDCPHEFVVHDKAEAFKPPESSLLGKVRETFARVAPGVKVAGDRDSDDGHVNSILVRKIRDANPGLYHEGRHPATLRGETKTTVAVYVDVSFGSDALRAGPMLTAPNKATAAHVVDVPTHCVKRVDFVPAVTGGALVIYRIELAFEKKRPGDREAFEAFGKKFDVHVAGAKR